MNENRSKLQNARNRRYPTETDADYAEDLTLLSNTPDQAEYLMLSLKQSAIGVGFCMNSEQTEVIWFNQDDQSSLNSKPLKTLD